MTEHDGDRADPTPVAATWTDHLRYHREEPCDCEPPADALEELTRLARENGLSVSVSRPDPTPVAGEPQTEAGQRLLAMLPDYSAGAKTNRWQEHVQKYADAILAIEAEAQRLTVERLRANHTPEPGTNSDSDFGSMWQACSCGWNKPGSTDWDDKGDQDADWWDHIAAATPPLDVDPSTALAHWLCHGPEDKHMGDSMPCLPHYRMAHDFAARLAQQEDA